MASGGGKEERRNLCGEKRVIETRRPNVKSNAWKRGKEEENSVLRRGVDDIRGRISSCKSVEDAGYSQNLSKGGGCSMARLKDNEGVGAERFGGEGGPLSNKSTPS